MRILLTATLCLGLASRGLAQSVVVTAADYDRARYPIGPEYEASSNVVHAHKLQGKLLLVLPELDTNVDPSSTMQVVNALIKANRTFDLLVMPGEEHGGGRRGPSAACGDRKMWDFFVHNLLGAFPPKR